ncbi:MAG: oligosaccharide flippase family protein, partial [Paracoccaceae bacterium]
MSITRDFSRGVAWMALGNWVEQAVNFAVFVTLARLLGASDYGLLAMASVFIVMCEALVRESLSEYLISAKNPAPEDMNATFWLLTGFGLLLALGLAAASGLAARLYGEAQVQWLILALCPSIVIVAMNAVPVALLRRTLSFRILAIRAVAGAVLGGITGIGMALAGLGVWSFVGQWLVMIGTNAVLAWVAADWRPGLATSARQMMTAARFGLHVIGMRLGELTAGQVPTVAIGATLGPEATGLYAVAWKLIETLSFLLVTPIRQASQSAFAALMRQGEGAGDLLQDISRLSSAIAVPFFCGLALLSGPMVALVFGAGWESAAPVLAVLSAIGIYLCLARVQVSFCLAAGAPGPVALVLWVTAGLIAALIL